MADSKRVALFLSTEAAALLPQLAPSENKQGQYVSHLILRAAHERGLIAAPPLALTESLDLATLQQQLRAAQEQVRLVEEHYRSLQERVTAALGA